MVFSIDLTDCHNIDEIMLKVALNTPSHSTINGVMIGQIK